MSERMTERGSDVVVVGAGIIGAACAYFGARAGLSVTVLDRGAVGGGTTSRCEGNILVSDKEAGPELDLALASRGLWLQLAAEHGGDAFELEEKGGLVVATGDPGLASLRAFAAGQGAIGVTAVPVSGGDLREYEPNLAEDLPGGTYYPQDLQVQPVLAAASLLAAARDLGARIVTGAEVTGALPGGRRAAHRSPHDPGDLSHRGRGQRRGNLGGGRRGTARRLGAGVAAAGVHPGHRAAATRRAPQGLLGRLRGERGL
jgi:D-hydroxyproline dehydrogenase subunit beta